jgi:hypothetical protein
VEQGPQAIHLDKVRRRHPGDHRRVLPADHLPGKPRRGQGASAGLNRAGKLAGKDAGGHLARPLAGALISHHPPQAALLPGGREPGIKPGNRLLSPVATALPKGRAHHVLKAKPVPVKAPHPKLSGHLGHRPL